MTDFQKRLESARALGPLIGGILGIVPQCGFSVLASGLYMNRSISLGTLLAVFISTSDEAIPILVAQPKQINVLFSVIAVKLVIAVLVGYIVDLLVRGHRLKENHPLHDIHAECEKESVEEHHSIVYIAMIRTIKIFIFCLCCKFCIVCFHLLHWGGYTAYHIGTGLLSAANACGSGRIYSQLCSQCDSGTAVYGRCAVLWGTNRRTDYQCRTWTAGAASYV